MYSMQMHTQSSDPQLLPLSFEKRGGLMMTSRHGCSKGCFVNTRTNGAVSASIKKHLHYFTISERGGCMQGSAM